MGASKCCDVFLLKQDIRSACNTQPHRMAERRSQPCREPVPMHNQYIYSRKCNCFQLNLLLIIDAATHLVASVLSTEEFPFNFIPFKVRGKTDSEIDSVGDVCTLIFHRLHPIFVVSSRVQRGEQRSVFRFFIDSEGFME